jgi:hypothetical protein
VCVYICVCVCVQVCLLLQTYSTLFIHRPLSIYLSLSLSLSLSLRVIIFLACWSALFFDVIDVLFYVSIKFENIDHDDITHTRHDHDESQIIKCCDVQTKILHYKKIYPYILSLSVQHLGCPQ